MYASERLTLVTGMRHRAAVSIAMAVTLFAVGAQLNAAVAASTTGTTHTSLNVAYVFDDAVFPCGSAGCGLNDARGPGSGASIFVNALTGTAAGTGNTGSYTPATGSTSQVSFTNVPLSTLDSNPGSLNTFDTAVIYETCSIGSPTNAPALAAINNFVNAGGKLMMFDADACSSAANGPADWSQFAFPFSTNSPGPQGASGSYTAVVPSALTTGLSTGSQPGDAVGDANIFTTFTGSWFRSITATNVNNVNGIVEAYARSPKGGLAIYEGEDFWFTEGPNSHLQLVFDDMLNQTWNPDGLPSSAVASGISLAPGSQTISPGGTATLTTTVSDNVGNPVSGVQVSFSVQSGPDAGKTGTGTTAGDGSATFSYVGASGGTDTVQATFVDGNGMTHQSNSATVTVGPGVALQPYVALGDSYSSGEGNPPFFKPDKHGCHRSISSAWPDMLGRDTSINIYLRAILACSGAKTSDLTGQLKALKKLAGVKLVTVTIGGDDIGFKAVLADCFTKGSATILNGGVGTNCARDGTILEAERDMVKLANKLPGIYNSIQAAAPGAAVIIVGYPNIFPEKQKHVRNCLWLDSNARSGLNSLASELDNSLAGVASLAGLPYVSTLNVLAGHELCTKHSWMNRIDPNPFTSFAGHPNIRGQQAIEKVVATEVKRLGF